MASQAGFELYSHVALFIIFRPWRACSYVAQPRCSSISCVQLLHRALEYETYWTYLVFSHKTKLCPCPARYDRLSELLKTSFTYVNLRYVQSLGNIFFSKICPGGCGVICFLMRLRRLYHADSYIHCAFPFFQLKPINHAFFSLDSMIF